MLMHVLIFFAGEIAGLFGGWIIFHAKKVGTLVIDRSGPDRDLYSFKLTDADLDHLENKKKVILAISHENANKTKPIIETNVKENKEVLK